MDYIFDDDRIEIGSEIDAYCTRCKANTPQTVVTKFEEEIRSVHCATCNNTHAYRAPRGDPDDEIPEPIAVRRRQSLTKLPWSEFMQGLDTSTAQPYSPMATYKEGGVIRHPKFGLGYISELMSGTKLEATFEDDKRILIYNRDDLAIVGEPSGNGSLVALAAAAKKEARLAKKKAKAPAKKKPRAPAKKKAKAPAKKKPKAPAKKKAGAPAKKKAQAPAKKKAKAPAKKKASAPKKKARAPKKKAKAPARTARASKAASSRR